MEKFNINSIYHILHYASDEKKSIILDAIMSIYTSVDELYELMHKLNFTQQDLLDIIKSFILKKLESTPQSTSAVDPPSQSTYQSMPQLIHQFTSAIDSPLELMPQSIPQSTSAIDPPSESMPQSTSAIDSPLEPTSQSTSAVDPPSESMPQLIHQSTPVVDSPSELMPQSTSAIDPPLESMPQSTPQNQVYPVIKFDNKSSDKKLLDLPDKEKQLYDKLISKKLDNSLEKSHKISKRSRKSDIPNDTNDPVSNKRKKSDFDIEQNYMANIPRLNNAIRLAMSNHYRNRTNRIITSVSWFFKYILNISHIKLHHYDLYDHQGLEIQWYPLDFDTPSQFQNTCDNSNSYWNSPIDPDEQYMKSAIIPVGWLQNTYEPNMFRPMNCHILIFYLHDNGQWSFYQDDTLSSGKYERINIHRLSSLYQFASAYDAYRFYRSYRYHKKYK